MVIVASDRFEVATKPGGDATVSSYYLPGAESAGKSALDTAARAIEIFGARFGAYPYPELDVVEVRLGGVAGMESTELVMIGSGLYAEDPLAGMGEIAPGAAGLSVLGFTTAHEVAHQWWHGVVGSDAYKQPWLDESLTNWSSELYVAESSGADAGLLARDLFIAIGYRRTLAHGDVRLDQPVDAFSASEYGTIVYGKGALMYAALRRQLSDTQFFEFLRSYYDRHRFARASGDDWRATLVAVAGQPVADAFYAKWVTGASIAPADLPPGGPMDALLSSVGGAPSPTATP